MFFEFNADLSTWLFKSVEAALQAILRATSLDEVREIVASVSAAAASDDIILYAGTTRAAKKAARLTDMHTCPMVTVLVPHVGGPIVVGCPTVLTGGLPAARVGDIAVCVGPPDAIALGSATVLIGGIPAARLGDLSVHGGVIVTGLPTVLIGG